MSDEWDRSEEDLYNVVHLEHINTSIPDQRLATIFYVMGLGLTRDPYLMTGVSNMWVNVGRSQFHLPTGRPQVVRGHTGVVMPDRRGLLERLTNVRGELTGSHFAFSEHDAYVEVTSPWGNILHCYEPATRFGPFEVAIPYVEFNVPVGTAAIIARFYGQILGSAAEVIEERGGHVARCAVGHSQHLLYRESDRPLPEYDEHHIQIYLADFSGPHRRLRERKLISEESNRWQYRFRDVVDLDTGRPVFTIEHEVRSMTHPMFHRVLINRDPARTDRNFAPARESRAWSTP